MKWGLNKADDFWNFVNVIVNEKIRKVCMRSLSPLLELPLSNDEKWKLAYSVLTCAASTTDVR